MELFRLILDVVLLIGMLIMIISYDKKIKNLQSRLNLINSDKELKEKLERNREFNKRVEEIVTTLKAGRAVRISLLGNGREDHDARWSAIANQAVVKYNEGVWNKARKKLPLAEISISFSSMVIEVKNNEENLKTEERTNEC